MPKSRFGAVCCVSLHRCTGLYGDDGRARVSCLDWTQTGLLDRPVHPLGVEHTRSDTVESTEDGVGIGVGRLLRMVGWNGGVI